MDVESAASRIGGTCRSREADVAPDGLAHVGRERLLDRLDTIPPGGTGLIVAPAGSGKTVVVDQWLEANPDVAACRLVLPTSGETGDELSSPLMLVLTGWASQRIPAATASADLIDDVLAVLETHSDQIVLVVDDMHLLESDMIAALGALAARLPLHVRLLMSSRWDPAMPARLLRLSRRLVDLRAADLAFTEDEADELLRHVSGRQLDRADVQSLVERTGGWAAGLQLAGISLQHVTDPAAFVEDFAGTDRLVVEYLTDEVLDALDPATRRFLGCTSILPWITPELGDAVTGQYDGRHQLKTLSHRSLFMVPLDQRGHRFRYHPLFAELLRYEFLDEHGVDEQRRLRTTAAEWLLQRGHTAEAVDQLMQAEAWSDVLAVIDTHGRTFLERGDAGSLVTWLTEIHARLPLGPPSIAVNLLAAQIASQQYIGAAETHRRVVRRSDLSSGERVMVDALYSCLCLDGLPAPQVIEVATDVLAALARLDATDVPDILGIDGWTSAEAFAHCMTGYAHLGAGHVEEAADHFEQVSTSRGMQYAVWRVHAMGAQALARAWAGQLCEAELLARRTVQIADTAGIPQHTSSTAAHLALASVCLDRCEPIEAEVHLLEAELRARRNGGRLFNDLHALLDTRRLALADGPLSALRRLRDSVPLSTSCPLVIDAAAALECRLLLDLGRIDAARPLPARAVTPMTAAEMRIQLALADGDVPRATRELELWASDSTLPFGVVEHGAVRSAVLLAAGDVESARRALVEAATVAELDGIRRPFVERPALLRLAGSDHDSSHHPFLASLVAARPPTETRRRGQSRLVDPLTERELAVLEFLPTRLTNQEIAAALYVSVNTVKTHVRSIYRKLDAADRNAAVRNAREFGLL